MPTQEHVEATLATHTSNGWFRFVTPHTGVVPGRPLVFGSRLNPDAQNDSHGEKDGVRKTFLAQSTQELPYYTYASDEQASALGRAANTLLGAVNNRLKTPGEKVSTQSEAYKMRRDTLRKVLFGSALTLVADEIDLDELGDDERLARTEATLDFLGGPRGLSNYQLTETSNRLVVATRKNIQTALDEIAEKAN